MKRKADEERKRKEEEERKKEEEEEKEEKEREEKEKREEPTRSRDRDNEALNEWYRQELDDIEDEFLHPEKIPQ